MTHIVALTTAKIRAYLSGVINEYLRDPPDTNFQRGFCSANLEIFKMLDHGKDDARVARCEAYLVATRGELPPIPDLDLYSLTDDPSRPAGFMLITAEKRAIYCDDEKLVATVQRAWRVLHGCDPETGEPGFADDYVLKLECSG